MKVIVTFSGGKDSLAALLWVREHITTNFTTVFCDTGWEHPLTYEYINRIADKLHLDLVTLKSHKYDGMVDLARAKKALGLDAGAVLYGRTQNQTDDRLCAGRSSGQYADDSGHQRRGISGASQDVGAMYVLQILFRALQL